MGAHFNGGISDVMQDLASIVVRYYFSKTYMVIPGMRAG
jgi:hypothetical protein